MVLYFPRLVEKLLLIHFDSSCGFLLTTSVFKFGCQCNIKAKKSDFSHILY